jgi:hypothetical protein
MEQSWLPECQCQCNLYVQIDVDWVQGSGFDTCQYTSARIMRIVQALALALALEFNKQRERLVIRRLAQ